MEPILDRSLFQYPRPRSRWPRYIVALAGAALLIPATVGALNFHEIKASVAVESLTAATARTVSAAADFIAAIFHWPQASQQMVYLRAQPAAAILAQAEPQDVVAASTTEEQTSSLPQPATIINQPVIERIIERDVLKEAALTQAQLDSQLAALRSELSLAISNSLPKAYTFSGPSPSTPVTFQSFAHSQKIDQLANVTITNATVSGVSGLTDDDIPDTITASNYLPLSGGSLTNVLDGTYLTMSSTTATSTFAGNLSVSGNLNFDGAFLQNGAPFVGSQWTTSGSSIYYASGSVGIGTTTPWKMLSVAGDIVGTNITATGTITTTGITNTGTLSQTGGANFTNASTTLLSVFNKAYFGATATSSFDSAGALTLATPLLVSSGGTGASTFGQGWIYSDGGTGALSASTSPTVAYITATSTSRASTFPYASTTALSVSGTAYFPGSGIWNSSGNVGIGTTSPVSTFAVQQAGYNVPIATFANTTAGYTAAGIGIDGWGTNFGSALFYNGSPVFSAESNGGMIVGSTYIQNNDAPTNGAIIQGNVGIGTTSPRAKLDVTDTASLLPSIIARNTSANNIVGFALMNDAASQNINSRNWGLFTNGNNYGQLDLVISADKDALPAWNSTAVMSWQKSGNVGIATTSPWRKLSVTGTVGFDGLTGATGAGSLCLSANREVVYNSASDACLPSLRDTKHDISSLSLDGLSIVDALDPVSFVYNEGDGRTRYGFIAEDTAAVDPHLTTYSASGTLSGIDDRSILAVVVKAIQALWRKVEDILARLSGAEARISTLEAEIAAIRAQVGAAGGSGNSSIPADQGEPDTEPPTITINGNNPATLQVGDTYNDLGATVSDNVDTNLGYRKFLDGVLVTDIAINASEAGEHSIDYVATDNAGNTATSTRTVIVEAPSTVPTDTPVEEPEGETAEELGPEEELITS